MMTLQSLLERTRRLADRVGLGQPDIRWAAKLLNPDGSLRRYVLLSRWAGDPEVSIDPGDPLPSSATVVKVLVTEDDDRWEQL